jgi:integrase
MKPQKVKNKNGTISYRVFVSNKITQKRESKTFSTRALAQDWADKRVKEIEGESINGKQETITVTDAIAAYQEMYPNNIGRSKGRDLERLKSYDIAKMDASKINAQDLIRHIADRNRVVKPQTAINDLIWLRTVLKTMSVTLGFPIDLTAFAQASEVLRKQKLISKADKRTRLITFREIIKLGKYYRAGKHIMPMYDIFLFALFSTRRLEEITRIRWADNNDAKQTGLMTAVKHPTLKKGNDKRFKYDACAWRIVQRQPKTSEYIFPYNPKSISANFTRACRTLMIEDLHMHDLRHSSITRLACKGYSVDQLRHFSLHDSYASLAIYVNTKPEDLY